MTALPTPESAAGLSASSVAARFAAIERACDELAVCQVPAIVIDVRNRAEALRHYLHNAKRGLELVNKAAEMKMRAERRMGQLLVEMNLREEGVVPETGAQRATLRQLNITRNQSSRWQRAAEVPEEVFNKFIAGANERGIEPSTAALLRLSTWLRNQRKAGQTKVGTGHPFRGSPPPAEGASLVTVQEMMAELRDHWEMCQSVFSDVFDAPGTIDLYPSQKRYLRHLVRECTNLIAAAGDAIKRVCDTSR